MTLAPGARLGPYEIVALLGSGGMGEVYRARDSRLGRDVAIKVLLAGFSRDSDRLQRFEQEARTSGMLHHPNIVSVYDIGSHEGAPFIVAELLEGTTVRDVLKRGPLPARKVVDYGSQIARALDAAHRTGIIHRDLKPENLIITTDGQVKILDFGLAKLKEPERPIDENERATWVCETQPGLLLGTIGYMSPEQVRAEPVDHRADLFALGAILYEMLTGARAFERASGAETMTAILKEDPPELPALARIPPALERIVRRCLEKQPEQRFHSAHDLALALEALSTGSRISAFSVLPSRTLRRALWPSLAAAVILSTVGVATYVLGNRPAAIGAVRSDVPAPTFQRLTFRRGWISAARFAPEGRMVLYSARWDGSPAEIFLVGSSSSESRPLGISDSDLLGVSPAGELAILRHSQLSLNIYHRLGTLARVSLGGGAPRDVLESIRWADWSPDGAHLAVIRDAGDRRRLEYPIGTVLYDTANTPSNTIVAPRVSPAGDAVAFFDGFAARVARWTVNVVDRAGKKTTLSRGWHDWWLLAWSARGDEVWFGASEAGSASALYAANRAGQQRVVFRVPGTVELHDVARDGRALVTSIMYRTFTRGVTEPAGPERDLSWLDASAAVDLSHDGAVLLLDEHGEGGGAMHAAYLRDTRGSDTIRLGTGRALALSPDGQWVLATIPGPPLRLFLLPTGAGETRTLNAARFEVIRTANWSPDGTRLLLAAAEPGRGLRLYLQDLDGDARAITPEGYDMNGRAIAPDGTKVAAIGPRGEVVVTPLDGGDPRVVPGLSSADVPIGWTADGRGLYVFRRGELPARVFRVDVASGRKHLWRTFMPPDAAGIGSITSVLVTPDGSRAVYSYEQALSELYLISGLR